MLTDYERGVLVGLVLGEASFTGDRSAPCMAVAMHKRHGDLLRWACDRIPGARLYGPYEHAGREFMRLMVRGRALDALLEWLEPEVVALCPHVAGRIETMRERHGVSRPTPR